MLGLSDNQPVRVRPGVHGSVLVKLMTLAAAFLAGVQVFSGSACAQQENPSTPAWGILSPTEIGRDYLASDPAADAAVVFDQGDIIVGPGFNFTLLRRCRIQIFSPAGYRYATVRIPYRNNEKILNLRAHTITPFGRQVPVPKDRMYNIDNGQWRALVFAFPEVTPGSVVEYRYELQSRDFYYLRPWVFQTDIPTEYSEVAVHLPPGFEYAAVVNGTGVSTMPIPGMYYSPEHRNARIRTFSWVAHRLPALRPVTFLPTLEDYRSRLDFQIVSYRGKDIDRKFIDSWPDLIDRVRSWYAKLLTLSLAARKRASVFSWDRTLPFAYAEQAYRFCRDSIAPSPAGGSVLAEDVRSAAEVLADRRGSPVEKNLLLIALLRHAGLDADPVLISTRDHLRFDQQDHRLNQFNHAIVRLELGGEPVFLDASDLAGWFGLLPPAACVDQGVWVAPGKGSIVELPSPGMRHCSYLEAELWLDPDGTARGHVKGRLTGYRAWEWARRTTRADFEQFLRATLLAPSANIRVLDVTVPEHVQNGAVDFAVNLQWDNAAAVGSGRLYFRPTGLAALAENPLADPQRRLPVSFAYPYEDVARVVWHLPPGYIVVEVPRGGGKYTDNLNFSCRLTASPQTVTACRRLSVERRDFPFFAYGELQNFFDCVVDIDRDLAVGVRTDTPPAAAR